MVTIGMQRVLSYLEPCKKDKQFQLSEKDERTRQIFLPKLYSKSSEVIGENSFNWSNEEFCLIQWLQTFIPDTVQNN